jgi:hypothetical protein
MHACLVQKKFIKLNEAEKITLREGIEIRLIFCLFIYMDKLISSIK